jgi:hypothetical protein
MREVRVHDTLSGELRTLEPRDPPRVGIYACGPTVYGRVHVGNARPYVVFALLKRFLEREGYDTTLAAFRHVQESYADDKVNSVVLLTDGRDEDNPDGIDRAELLEALRDEFDPDAPVPVITIGFGPDADMEALQDISEATGTRAYQAEDPEDIDEVFARAMLERICRPDC